MKFLECGFMGIRMRHIVIFLAFIVVFVLAMFIVVGQSDALADARHFVHTNDQIVSKIGAVSKSSFRPFDEWALDGGAAQFSFSVKGAQRDAVVEVHMKQKAGIWQVDVAYLRAEGERQVYEIRPKTGAD